MYIVLLTNNCLQNACANQNVRSSKQEYLNLTKKLHHGVNVIIEEVTHFQFLFNLWL